MPNLPKQAIFQTTLVLAGVALLALSAVSVTAVTLPACRSCHMTEGFEEDTSKSPHASVSCVACHVGASFTGRVSFATRQVFHMVIPVVPEVDRVHAAVPDKRCLSCHSAVEEPVTVGTRGLFIKHSSCMGDSSCTDCHSLSAHGASTRWPRTAQMEDCYECHGRSNKITACDACHTERSERQRIFDGPFRVTHGPQWKKTHGMGDMRSCVACHDETRCKGCHGAGVPHEGDFLKAHTKYSTRPDADCTGCHRQEFCSECHRYEMPHPQRFVQGHSGTVEADGDAACLTCHEKGDCTQCHEDHVHPVTREQMDGFMLKRTDSGGGAR
ncbi:MAG: hypothetical protein IBX62_07320 [Coriobacteriia bacterium]|nr:hypothetical protein [Coriobacteriia bacterium]